MLSPVYLSGDKGRLFVQQFLPKTGDSEQAVLLVPPFAEELNKSRRMLALLGRELSQAGKRVVLPDLYGTGDSGGDFADADWQTWKQDLACVTEFIIDNGAKQIILVGLRMGCLLAADTLLTKEVQLQKLVFWQPALSGKHVLNQFLRLRVALGMMSGKRESIADLRQLAMEHGEVEVAGYSLSQSMIQDIDQLDMADLLCDATMPMQWIEVQTRADQSLPLPVQKLQQALMDSGVHLTSDVVVGESFWSTQEIVEVPELIDRTVQFVRAGYDAPF